MEIDTKVSIVTCSCRHADGSFCTSIESVYHSEKKSRKQLDRIMNRVEGNNSKSEWRAIHPDGNPDIVFIEQNINDEWVCQVYYELITKDVLHP